MPMAKNNTRKIPPEKSLAARFPEIAKEWNYTKNGDLMPWDVSPGSHKKVWWFLPYDDPETGKHFDFEWEATIDARTYKNSGCPYLAGKKVWPGYNDLATKRPDIAVQWNYAKNGSLTPDNVVVGSHKKVWWLLPYDDPETGNHYDFEWEALINERVIYNLGCPYLTGRKVWPGFNDLATKRPDLIIQWHTIKNGSLTPEMVTVSSNKRVWWLLPYDDPETGNHYDFEWEADIESRACQNKGCPYLTGQKVWPGFNDLATKRPDLAAQWNYAKNGKLTPEMVMAGSSKKVWWFLPYDDPETGNHYDFEWEACIVDRTSRNLGCPYLTGKKVWPGFNDLATKRPDLAMLWHPTKNGKLTPENVIYSSKKNIWWYQKYRDPKTGKTFEFEWQNSICVCAIIKEPNPYLRNDAVWPGYNDLETKAPELAAQWDYEKNRGLKPCEVVYSSKKKYWWKCPDCGESWYMTTYARVHSGQGCPYCNRGKRLINPAKDRRTSSDITPIRLFKDKEFKHLAT